MCASSSTRQTAGRRRRIASTSISSTMTPRYSMRLRGMTSSPSSTLRVCGRPCVSTKPDDDVLAVVPAPLRLVEHRVRLADAGKGAEVDTQRAACAASRSSRCSLQQDRLRVWACVLRHGASSLRSPAARERRGDDDGGSSLATNHASMMADDAGRASPREAYLARRRRSASFGPAVEQLAQVDDGLTAAELDDRGIRRGNVRERRKWPAVDRDAERARSAGRRRAPC